MIKLWDDPALDFRQRYKVPEQFVWEENDFPRIIFDGYMRVVLSMLPSSPARVIDIGCGPGLGTKILCDHGYKVTGIDYSERGIGFAKILVPEAHFYQVDIRLLQENLQLHHQFDAAIHIEVIEHIPPAYHELVVSNIRQTLRPSGTLIITVPSCNLPLHYWHYKHFSQDEITGLLTNNGFAVKKIIHQQRLGIINSPYLWALASNRVYDLRFVRYLRRYMFLKWFNTTDDPAKAGRLVIQAEAL
ncbi:MAG: Ubiquinone biosynthesis O-methyltransferase [Anaerolineae bacterium]|nr:Ubiquinone biosynthesis O-methyltransferase [Anaerolineae bacterium]